MSRVIPPPDCPADQAPPRLVLPGTAAPTSPPVGAATPSSPSLPACDQAETETPDPVTGAADPDWSPAAPGRGRTQAPAGSAPDTSAPPDGTAGLRGQEARDAIKRAQSVHNAAKSRRRTTRKPEAARPGMIRRAAPEKRDGAL